MSSSISSFFKRSGSGRASGRRSNRPSSSEAPSVPSSLNCFKRSSRDEEKEEEGASQDDSQSGLETISDNDVTEMSRSICKKQYNFIRALGRGASGVVFEAQNRISGKKVAIKEINMVKGQDVDKILREVQLVANLEDHPNVISIYHAWIESSSSPLTTSLYFTMELCQEGTLRSWLDENVQREPQEIMSFFKQLVRGICHIHKAGLIHRDIKPANIMMSKRGSDVCLKLGDFGIVAKDDAKPHTLNIGTPFYMSPEAEDDCLYTNKVDIFALGMILIELHFDLTDKSDRREVLSEAKNGVIKPFLHAELAKQMLKHQYDQRPEASQILECLESLEDQKTGN